MLVKLYGGEEDSIAKTMIMMIVMPASEKWLLIEQ